MDTSKFLLLLNDVESFNEVHKNIEYAQRAYEILNHLTNRERVSSIELKVVNVKGVEYSQIDVSFSDQANIYSFMIPRDLSTLKAEFLN